MKPLDYTKNPFLNIAINIANSNEFNRSSFDLINFLLDHEHNKQYDVNESIFIEEKSHSHYGYQNNTVYLRNFFNIIFIMDQSFNPELINKLVSIGMKIDPFLKDKNGSIENDILFSRPELDERRNIFLMNLYLQQNGIENFTQQIQKFNTLHRSVSLNKLKLVEFLLKNVSIDLPNDNLETCLMYVRNPETLDFLATYQPNWSQKDILGNNISSFFSGHQDDSVKKVLLDKFFNYLSNYPGKKQDNNSEFITTRLKETLIDLVEKNGTKAELQSFIKKYKIKNIESITNSNNRTLSHICIANGDFARSSIFEGTDYYHIDNNGYNIFNSLFTQTNISSSTKLDYAKNILLNCLKDKDKCFTEKTFNRLINDSISSYNFSIPSWVIRDITLRNRLFECLDVNYSDININSLLNHSNTSNDNYKNYFSLFKNLIKKYDLEILNSNFLDKFFDLNSYTTEHYFNKNNAENLFELLLVCHNIGKIDIDDFLSTKFKNINNFLTSLRKTHSIYNKESYESHEVEAEIDKSFYSKVCCPFFEFLTKNKIYNVIEMIDEDLMNKVIKNDTKGELNEFLKTYSYLKINNKLSSSKKIKQHKI